MVAALKLMKENGYGPNSQQVVQLITRLSDVKWFSALGKPSGRVEAERALKEFTQSIEVGDYQIVWLEKDQLPSLLEEISLGNNPIWSRIQGIPKQLRDQVEEQERQAALSYTLDYVPEILFHKAFDGAFPELHEYGERVVKVAVGSVMYLFGLACAWETLADIEGWETNPFIPLIKAFEAGHWPVGMIGNQIYMI